MPQRTPHLAALGCKAFRPERGVEVGLVQNLVQVAEGQMPQNVVEMSGLSARKKLMAFVRKRGGIPECSLAKELRRAVVAVPAGAMDPSSHEVVHARNVIGVLGG